MAPRPPKSEICYYLDICQQRPFVALASETSDKFINAAEAGRSSCGVLLLGVRKFLKLWKEILQILSTVRLR
jgi:hypothetical protein